MQNVDKVEIFLLSFPNKTIEIPSLGLSVLKGKLNVDGIKRMLQHRNYKEIFCDKINSEIFTQLIPLISKSNIFFNLIISNPKIEKDFPDLFIFKMLNAYFESIILNNPYLIGLSIVEMQRQFSLWAINRLKIDFGFKGKIIVGGSDITYFNSYVEYFSNIDYGIYQEGEVSLPKLVKCLKEGSGDLENIHNLIYRNENNHCIINKSEKIKNFEYIIPDFTDLPLEKYITNALPIQASRGCSWAKCIYCKHFKTYGEDYYEANPKLIVNQINLLKEKYNTSLFHFVDDDFLYYLKNSISEELRIEGESLFLHSMIERNNKS